MQNDLEKKKQKYGRGIKRQRKKEKCKKKRDKTSQ